MKNEVFQKFYTLVKRSKRNTQISYNFPKYFDDSANAENVLKVGI